MQAIKPLLVVVQIVDTLVHIRPTHTEVMLQFTGLMHGGQQCILFLDNDGPLVETIYDKQSFA